MPDNPRFSGSFIWPENYKKIMNISTKNTINLKFNQI
jgi:hypothetical protein